tara:strand:- start:1067 stop:2263 length:1197 start_codon:yes stop_codon:yes gene_type:complete
MPKSLSDIQIKNIKKLGNHRVGPSLYIHVKQERKLWYLRQTMDGKRKWIYIGTYPAISPKEAREKAAALLSSDQAPQAVLRDEKIAKIQSLRQAQKKSQTFTEIFHEYVKEVKVDGWKPGAKNEQSWNRSLFYLEPFIGHKQIEEITPEDMVQAIKPIWISTHETAQRACNRATSVINYAIAKGISDKRNPANYDAILKHLLPSHKKKIKNHASLHHQKLPFFMSELWQKNEPSYNCLKLIVLTQVRMKDALQALWTEFDLQSGVWLCPINKSGETHTIPIPKQLLWHLQEQVDSARDERMFPGMLMNRFLSNTSVTKSLRRFHRTDRKKAPITTHGFRSTFQTWALETHGSDGSSLADKQLGHVEKDKVKAAYERSDLFEQRVPFLQKYEDFALSEI